jgi:hypothetical protein
MGAVRTTGRAVLEDVVARAAEFGLPEAPVYVGLSAPDGLEDALLGRGAQLADTSDVLAVALPADVQANLPRLETRWATTPENVRDVLLSGSLSSAGARHPRTSSPNGRRRP